MINGEKKTVKCLCEEKHEGKIKHARILNEIQSINIFHLHSNVLQTQLVTRCEINFCYHKLRSAANHSLTHSHTYIYIHKTHTYTSANGLLSIVLALVFMILFRFFFFTSSLLLFIFPSHTHKHSIFNRVLLKKR